MRYKCERGYRLLGAPSRTCRRTARWSGTAPRCSAVRCRQPAAPAHGAVQWSSLEFQGEAEYRCQPGYRLVGERGVRVCGPAGEWEGGEPECELVRCPAPRLPLHSQADIQDLAAGGTVTFSCSPGYRLQGTRVLTCLYNSSWSNAVPTCNRVYCPVPAAPQHGEVVGEKRYPALSSPQYRCHTGSLSGRPPTCLPSGEWSGPVPACTTSLCPKLGTARYHLSIQF